MAQTTTQIQICNRGLQLLGSQPISAITDNSRGARAMNRAYQPVLLSELRKNFWGFAIKRTIIAAATVQPSFGPSNYFPLPGDFLMMAPQDQNTAAAFGGPPTFGNGFGQVGGQGSPRDWQIENNGSEPCIVSNDSAPIYLRYVSSNVTEANFDVCFAEAFSAALAAETCEEITQSNTKLAAVAKIYEDAIDQARKRNAFEIPPVISPTDPWILARY